MPLSLKQRHKQGKLQSSLQPQPPSHLLPAPAFRNHLSKRLSEMLEHQKQHLDRLNQINSEMQLWLQHHPGASLKEVLVPSTNDLPLPPA